MNTIDINTIAKSANIFNKNNNNLDKQSNPFDFQKNFLTLLITQIQNQDPTNPIKNAELTSQLAQINTVSGIQQLNASVNNISNEINQSRNVQLTSLIGRHVMIPNSEITFKDKDTPVKFGVEFNSHVTSIEVKILDKNNVVLYQKTLDGDREPGICHFSWDGKDLNHNMMSTGKYHITATAKNNDKNVSIDTLSQASVHSIITSSSDSIIDLGPEEENISLYDIRQII